MACWTCVGVEEENKLEKLGRGGGGGGDKEIHGLNGRLSVFF